MRILFISAFVPSSKTAGQNYSNLLLQELSRKCIVDLVLFRNKKSYTFDIESSNLHIKRYYTDTFISKLFNSLACIPFLFVYSLFFPRKVRSKILYMSHDVITQKYERMGNPFILWWVNRTERFILRGVDNKQRKIYTFSMKDVEYMNNKLSLKANSTNFFINKIVANALPVKVNDEYILFGAWKRPENSVGLLWILEFWKKQSEHLLYRQMYVQLDDQHLLISCFNRGKLLFSNSFPVARSQSIPYYILYVWKQLDLDALRDNLWLSGELRTDNLRVEQLRKFVYHVNPIEIPSEAYLMGGDVISAPLDLIALFLCES